MKMLALVSALLVGATAYAADPAFPVWGCKLKAKMLETQSSVELIIIRGETVRGQGTATCTTAVGQTTTQAVDVVLQSGGIGPAFNGPLQGLRIYAVRAGVATTDGMIGMYHLSAGPRLGLINARVGVMGGVQVDGQGVGAGVEAVIENRFSIGLDIGGMAMAIVPRGQGRNVRFN
jgi:hypothetical protein